MSNEPGKTANAEPNKPIEAQELTDKELEGVVGGARIEEKILDRRRTYLETVKILTSKADEVAT